MINRRDFIGRAALLALSPALTSISNTMYGALIAPLGESSDEALCGEKFTLALRDGLAKRPIADVIVAIGESFIGTEYGEHLLDLEGPERLVVNLRALDCVTFYENTLALSRCVKLGKTTFDDFKSQLQLLRYRGGVIDGYASRLHYTTDDWYDDEKRGILRVVTRELFGENNVHRIPTPVNFMSRHRSSYRQLSDGKAFDAIVKTEEALSKRVMYFLPKGNLHLYADRVKSGSIIGVTTNVPGLDVSHTGIAVRTEHGALHLLHAPNVGEKVQISKLNLHDYLARNARQTGIIVAEATEPS